MILKDKLKIKGILRAYALDTKIHGKREKESFEDRIKLAKLIREEENLITQIGFQTLANRITGSGTYASTTYLYFAVSDGSTTPAITDTASTFYADGTDYTKAVESVETFNTSTLLQQWNCFLNSAENTPATIRKFALMNTASGTAMFNELLFSAIDKNSGIELYFTYQLVFS